MDPKIQRVLAVIDSEPHQKLSLDGMARIARLSSSRLRHKFKAEVGITPTLYLRSVRLKMAAELLKNEDLSIKEVRAAIGMTSDSYFTHQFKRMFGTPPSRSRVY